MTFEASAHTEPVRVASRRTVALTGLALLALALGCRSEGTVLTQLDDARRLAADLRLHFSQASDASNRAVLADTDEASIASAREAEQASKAVVSDVVALEPALRALSFSSEAVTLGEFRARFADYQKLDGRILALAVENTNLKAQALSFGAAREAGTAFRAALAALAKGFPARDRCRVDHLVDSALLAVREIQVIYAPHIAEHGDGPMTRMEQEMAELDARARVALAELSTFAPPAARAALAEANSALDKFKLVTGQIVQLSRRNTNVLSLDLALRQKPALVTACNERLRALQEILASRGSKATR